MGMNFKPIGEVPEITEISEGDKLLVNSGGAARQIDAGRFAAAGSGSGSAAALFYTTAPFGGESMLVMAPVYADEACTQQLTYEQGVAMAAAGAALCTTLDGARNYVFPAIVMPEPELRVIAYIFSAMNQTFQYGLIFSDSVMEGI